MTKIIYKQIFLCITHFTIRKITCFLLLIFLLLLFGCFNKYPNIKNEPIPDEEYKIYSKILMSYFKIDSDTNFKKIIKIVKYTDLFHSLKNMESWLISNFGEYLSTKLIENNKYNYQLEQLFDPKVTKHIIFEFVANDFNSIYFSRVAYNENKTNCIVYFADATIKLAGRGFIVSLVKNNNGWEIKDMLNVWVS
jgi:hypothetical protein